MLRPIVFTVVMCASLSACNKFTDPEGKSGPDKALSSIIVAPEDVLEVQASAVASGPVVTGSLEPERKADLRAEVSAVVLQVLKENGQAVRQGDLLVRLDDTSIRDNLGSAEDNARNAKLALEQAERTVQRLRTLRGSGMTSLQVLDDAEIRRNTAQSDLSASQARAVVARQQLARTLVRAPFDGVVGDRKVSAGDTAAVGKELLKVLDPASMRFAGRVSADKISQVRLGQAVSFRVNGFAGQEFKGAVARIDPSVNDVTRQIEVLVSFVSGEPPRVSGLYAEGVIESTQVTALTVAQASVAKVGDQTWVWRIHGNTLERADVTLGARDARTGRYEVRAGLRAGDLIVRTPSASFKAGQTVQRVGQLPPAGPASAATAATATPTAAVASAQGN